MPKALSRFAAGVDISEVKTLQEQGTVYRVNGNAQDPLRILHHSGINWVRIRLFVHPDGKGPGTNDLPHDLAEAEAAKRNHLRVLVDMHFSDSWADPGHQRKPAAWANLSFADLVQQVKKLYHRHIPNFRRRQRNARYGGDWQRDLKRLSLA
jgi:arabinogalactan endo-1,4-beta-galactosidase